MTTIREQLEAIVPIPIVYVPGMANSPNQSTTWEDVNKYRHRVIDALCVGAMIIEGKLHHDGHWTVLDGAHHTAILLAPQPIQRGVSVREIVQEIKRGASRYDLDKLADRIEREGVLP